MSEKPSTQASTGKSPEWKLANQMVWGAMGDIRDAEHPTLVFQEALSLLKRDSAELVGSQVRHSVVAEIVARDIQANDGIAARIRNLLGKGDSHVFLSSEIAALEPAADQDSFVSLATLADMKWAKGDTEGAEADYKAALNAAMRSGCSVME